MVCKEWFYIIRSYLALSSNLTITIERGAHEINNILQSYPMLKSFQFKIPSDGNGSLEFIKGKDTKILCSLK